MIEPPVPGELRSVPVVSFLNQKGGVGKSTLSIHLATALAANGKVLLIDADPQGSALDWNAQRQEAAGFPVIGLPKPTLHREVAALGRPDAWTVIDGPPRANALAQSAIAASDLVLIPVQPSPFDVWAARDILDLLGECAVLRPDLQARFVLNRLVAGTRRASEVAEALASFEAPALRSRLRNRTEYAKAVRDGLTALETAPRSAAARDCVAFAAEVRALLEDRPNDAEA